MTKLILISMIFSGLCAAQEAQKKFEFKPGDAETLEIRTGAANMDISASETAITAEATGEYDETLCDFSAAVEGKTLKITLKTRESEKKWYHFWKYNENCKAGLRVTAPKGKKLAVKSGAGNMKIDGLSAGAEIDTGAGNLELKNFSGPLRVDSGAGSLKGDLYSEEVSVETGAGSVDLKWNSIPKKGGASVSSGAGNIVLSFPETTKMAITHKSGAGNFDSAFGNDPKAPFAVVLKTGAGNQEIRKY